MATLTGIGTIADAEITRIQANLDALSPVGTVTVELCTRVIADDRVITLALAIFIIGKTDFGARTSVGALTRCLFAAGTLVFGTFALFV